MNTEPQTKNATSTGCEIYVENAVKLRSWWKSNKPLNIWKITVLNCRERHKDMIDDQRYTDNISSCEIKAWKKNSGLNGIWTWYCRGHGFESHNAMINHVFISTSLVHSNQVESYVTKDYHMTSIFLIPNFEDADGLKITYNRKR